MDIKRITKSLLIFSLTLTFLLQLSMSYALADSWVADIDDGNDNDFTVLNQNPTHKVDYPVPQGVEYDGKLYLTWVEKNSSGKGQVRVCVYDGTNWTFIDGNGEDGLNFNPTQDYANNPSIVVSNGILYVSWYEWSESNPNGYFSHISKYNGTPGSWTRIDGGTGYGIRYNQTIDLTTPTYTYYLAEGLKLIDYNNKLYAVWSESKNGASGKNTVLASYDGTNWTTISPQLNTKFESKSTDMVVYNGDLYITFEEGTTNYTDANSDIRIKKYNADTGIITDVTSDNPLEYDTTINCDHNTKLISDGISLYAIWNELNSEGKRQIRAKKYDGTNWTSIDGNGTTGLNYDISRNAFNTSLKEYAGDIYASWYESNGTQYDQMRIKKYDTATANWTFVDDNGLTGGTGFTYGLNMYPEDYGVTTSYLAEYGSELFLFWKEDNKLYVKKHDSSWNISADVDNLSSLDVSSGSLYPTFNGSTKNYVVLVKNDVTTVNVTPAVVEPNATITVNGIALASGGSSQDINLEEGSNDVVIRVTSHRGVLLKKYVVKFVRYTTDGKIILTPTEDVTLYDETSGITNYGTDSVNFLGYDGSGTCHSFEKFDYSFLQGGTITASSFKIYIPTHDDGWGMDGVSGSPKFDFYYSDDDSWDETSATLPTKAGDIVSDITMTAGVTPTNAYYSFDQPGLLTAISGSSDKIITLVLQGDGTANGNAIFYSDDSLVNKPLLELTYVQATDLTAYNAALAAVAEADYTLDSWTAYQTVVTANVVTVANSQAEVNTATTNITTAQSSLVKKVDANLAAAKAAEDLLTEANYVDYSAVTTALAMPEGTDAEKIAKTTAINNSISALVEKVDADLTAYNAALAAANESDYTATSWTTYQTVVTANVVTVANSQAEVNTATTNITTAQSSLVKKVDANLAAAKAAEAILTSTDYVDYSSVTTALAMPEGTDAEKIAKTTAINEAITALVTNADLTAYNVALAAVAEADYTAISWTTYQTVVTANVVTVANSQAEVNTATTNITTSQSSLVKKVDANLAAAKAAEDLLTEANYVDYSAVTTALAMPEGTDAEKIAKTTAINEAITALVTNADLTAYNAALAAVNESDYTATSWTTYQIVVTANVVTVANSQAEVNTATTNITTAQSSLVKKVDANLAAAKSAEAVLTSTDYVDYSAVTIALAMSEGTDAEKIAKTTAINNAIAELVTKAEETELLAGAKTAAIKELNEYKESTDYSEENWVLITNMKSSGIEKINESTSPSAVTTSLAESKVQINAVKTLAKEKAEALEKAKEVAKVALNNDLATYTQTDYTEENWTILQKSKTDGDVAIDAATTLLEVETAKTNSIAAMNAVKTIAESVNTYVMTGYVIEEGTGNYVEGATVKLMTGSRQVEKTTTDSDGAFIIKNVSNGTYNLVINKDEQTVTLIISVLNNDVLSGTITLPNGKKNSIVEVKNDNLNIVVGNLNDYFNSNQFTDDEENVVDNGGTVEIKLTVEEKSENDADNAVNIKAIAGSSKTIGMYLDLNLNKVITTGSAISGTYAINELQNVLIINIQLPTELQGKNGYVIYRYHGTEVQTISKTINSDGEYFILSEDGKSLTLFTKKFSTYAIGYSMAINNDDDVDDNVDDDVAATEPIITSDSSKGGKVKISTDKKIATITPEDGYVIADVMVDGMSIGASSTYTFKDSKNHNIYAVFIEETALPYYMQGDKKVFIGLTAIKENLLKYTEQNGKAVKFAKNTKSFTDIENHWAKKTIEFVTEREILLGTENSKFSPNVGMTRAMFVTAIGRLYERSYGSIAGSTTFYDVDADAYYANYVAWANESNIINGIGENKFSPDAEVTREQMSEIIFRFAKYLDKAPTGDWMINVNYSDKSKISDWAMNSAAYCQMTNIITGRENNEFAPNDTATRAEVAAVIERFVKEMLK